MTEEQIDRLAFYLILIGAIAGGSALAFALWFMGTL